MAGGCDIRRAGRWYLVADEGGGLLPDMIPRPLWRDRRPAGLNQGAAGGSGGRRHIPRAAGGRRGGDKGDSVAGSLAAVYGNFGYCFEK